MALWNLFVTLIIFILSSLPLYFAVKILGGKISLIKAVLVTFIAGLLVTAIQESFQLFGGLIAFLVLIWIYREFFRLKWWKSFIAWVLQLLFVVLFYIVVYIIAGVVGDFSVLPSFF